MKLSPKMKALCEKYNKTHNTIMDIEDSLEKEIKGLKGKLSLEELKRFSLLLPDCLAKFDLVCYINKEKWRLKQ